MESEDKVIMTDDVKNSLAYDLILMFKKDNTRLKVLLGISILTNIILAIILR